MAGAEMQNAECRMQNGVGLPDPFTALPARLAGLSALAARVNAEAAAEKYSFAKLSRCECRLLYEMLASVGADDCDPVLAALIAHMASRERSRAKARSIGSRRRRGEA